MTRIKKRSLTHEIFCASAGAALGLLVCACAARSLAPDPARPRANEPPYPIVLAASEDRRERALAAWAALTGEQGGATSAPAPELQPVTASVRMLPQGLTAPLRLPKFATEEGKEPTEEETREILRRFIANESTKALLGVEPESISLVERVDNPDGTKRARYQQKPFPYPLRAGYGVLEITFTTDGRVLQLSSTAIPDAERIGRALANVRQQLTAEQAVARLTGRTVTYTDRAGNEQTYTVAGASDEVAVRELVVYPLRRADDPTTLVFHLAWEVAVGRRQPPLLVYVDAVTGETIAAAPAAEK
jgi:hypothetical protein